MKQTSILCYYSQRLNYSHTQKHSDLKSRQEHIHKNNKGGTGEKQHGKIPHVKKKTRNGENREETKRSTG